MQSTLAGLYLRGEGVLQDDREAFRWFSAAARNYVPYAYLALAELYADGRGTDRDLIEALAHCEIALNVLSTSETGALEKVRLLKSRIAQELSAQAMEQARRIAYEKRPDIMKR